MNHLRNIFFAVSILALMSGAVAQVQSQDCGTVTDYDGNTYKTVMIGRQCWMAENLRTTHYADGTAIRLGSDTSCRKFYRYYPNGRSGNVARYGYLYNWAAVMKGDAPSDANPSGVQGICPNGWHVPSNAEFMQLLDYVYSQPQYHSDGCSGEKNEAEASCIAKALATQTGWKSSSYAGDVGNNPSTNNATGFGMQPAGAYFLGYESFGNYAYLYSASKNSGFSFVHPSYQAVLCYVILYSRSSVVCNVCLMGHGMSVRCLRD